MAFSSEDPSIGILEPSGAVRFLVQSDIADLRACRRSGSRRMPPRSSSTFEAPGAALPVSHCAIEALSVLETPANAFAPPRQASSSFSVDGWRNGTSPTLNGLPLKLDDYETSRSFALSPDDRMLVLGTEWSVRAYRQKRTGAVAGAGERRGLAGGSESRWAHRRHRAVRRHPALAPRGGRCGVHGLVRPSGLWRMDHLDPQGCSFFQRRQPVHSGWHLNRGREGTPLFYRAVQFERLLYRPTSWTQLSAAEIQMRVCHPPAGAMLSTSRSSRESSRPWCV